MTANEYPMQSPTTGEPVTTAFRGARFASHVDLDTPRWRELFDDAQRYSDRYLAVARESGCWPSDYPWPPDALHCNTRIWEYPFVIDAIERFAPREATILDIGSALTFLPAYLAAKGHRVVASDIDPRMPRWFGPLAKALEGEQLWPADKVTYECLDVTRLDAAAGTFDVVTNVSVLEHLPMATLAAAARAIRGVLRPGGILVCTLDCWIDGQRSDHHHPLDQDEFEAFTDLLLEEFELIEGPQIRVPNDLITNDVFPRSITNHRVPAANESPLRRCDRYLRRVAKAVLGRRELPGLQWCVFGMTLRNR